MENGELDEYGIYQKLLHKAGFFFYIHKVKAALPNSWKNRTSQKKDNTTPENLLDTLFDVPGVGQKAPRDLSLKDIYNVFVVNKKPVIASKSYLEHKLQDNNINWNTWFTQNFSYKFMPRKCKDFNWKLFHVQLNIEGRLKKLNIQVSCAKFAQVILKIQNIYSYDVIAWALFGMRPNA